MFAYQGNDQDFKGPHWTTLAFIRVTYGQEYKDISCGEEDAPIQRQFWKYKAKAYGRTEKFC